MTLDIASYRLHNSRLSQTDLTQPVDVVHWLGAVQLQDYAGAKWAIGAMLKGTGIQNDDQALLANIVILDGQVIGGWKRTLKKNEVLVEARRLVGLSKARKQAIQEAAQRFGTFLQLPISYI